MATKIILNVCYIYFGRLLALSSWCFWFALSEDSVFSGEVSSISSPSSREQNNHSVGACFLSCAKATGSGQHHGNKAAYQIEVQIGQTHHEKNKLIS